MRKNATAISVATSSSHDEETQSQAISLLRFPLAIAVIFIHMDPAVTPILKAEFPLLSGHGILNIIQIALSHVIPSVAVPCFFLISGFLFFNNFREWNWDRYWKKMKSRTKTLLIPYILWCLLALFISTIRMFIYDDSSISEIWNYLKAINWHTFVNCRVWGINKVHIFGWQTYHTGPIIIPLWFLRDLIVVSILTPVFYWYIKKTGRCGIFLLFILYLTNVWTLKPGFSITAFFYFSLGAYEAIKGNNIIVRSKQCIYLAFPISTLLLVFYLILYGSGIIWGTFVSRLYIIMFIPVLFYGAGYLVEKHNVKPKRILTESCFFIYAAHTAALFVKWSPIALSNIALHKIIPGTSGLEDGLCYLLTPIVTASLCFIIYYVLLRICPKATAIFNGNRIEK